MATKTKKSKKPKKTEAPDVVVESSKNEPVLQSVRKRLLPHNMAHEIVLLQQRVSELEQKLASVLEQFSTK